MKSLWLIEESAWFAFGTWVGLTLVQYVELMSGEPLQIGSVVDDGSGLPLLVFGYAVVALIIAIPFAMWQGWRRSRSTQEFASSWLLPLSCGLIFMPLFVLSIPYLCAIVGEGRGARIGSLVMLILFGMPILFAEACLRWSSKSANNDAATH